MAKLLNATQIRNRVQSILSGQPMVEVTSALVEVLAFVAGAVDKSPQLKAYLISSLENILHKLKS